MFRDYRILYNELTFKYKVQVRSFLFFWTTLQYRIKNTIVMTDALFDSHKEAYKSYLGYLDKKGILAVKWRDVSDDLSETDQDYGLGAG